MATAVSFFYNLPIQDENRDTTNNEQKQQQQPLTLDACTIAKIFTGKVRYWNDPSILATNPSTVSSSTKGGIPKIPIEVTVLGIPSTLNLAVSTYLYQWCPSEFPIDLVSPLPKWTSSLQKTSNTKKKDDDDDDDVENEPFYHTIHSGGSDSIIRSIRKEYGSIGYSEIQYYTTTSVSPFPISGSSSSSGTSSSTSTIQEVRIPIAANAETFLSVSTSSVVNAPVPPNLTSTFTNTIVQYKYSSTQDYSKDDDDSTGSTLRSVISNAIQRHSFPSVADLNYHGTIFVSKPDDTVTATVTTWPIVLVSYMIVPKDLSKILPNMLERTLLISLLEYITGTNDAESGGSYSSATSSSTSTGSVIHKQCQDYYNVVYMDEHIRLYTKRGIDIIRNYPANNYTGAIIDGLVWSYDSITPTTMTTSNDNQQQDSSSSSSTSGAVTSSLFINSHNPFVLSERRRNYNILRTQYEQQILVSDMQSIYDETQKDLVFVEQQIQKLNSELVDLLSYKDELIENIAHDKKETTLSQQQQSTISIEDYQRTQLLAKAGFVLSFLSFIMVCMIMIYSILSYRQKQRDDCAVADDIQQQCALCRYQKRSTSNKKNLVSSTMTDINNNSNHSTPTTSRRTTVFGGLFASLSSSVTTLPLSFSSPTSTERSDSPSSTSSTASLNETSLVDECCRDHEDALPSDVDATGTVSSTSIILSSSNDDSTDASFHSTNPSDHSTSSNRHSRKSSSSSSNSIRRSLGGIVPMKLEDYYHQRKKQQQQQQRMSNVILPGRQNDGKYVDHGFL